MQKPSIASISKIFFSLDPKSIFIILVVLFIAAFFLLSAYYLYPAAGGDSLFFTLPGVNFAANHQLTSPLFVDGRVYDELIDTTGQRRFMHYPPLFPLLLGYLMPSADPQGAFILIALINVLVVVLSAAIFLKLVKLNGSLNWFLATLIGLALFGVATTADQSMGRPEILARLFFTLGLAGIFYINQRYHWLILGILLGLVGATHPAAGLMAALLLMIFFSARYKYKKALTWVIASVFVSLLVFLAAIRVGPFSLTETLDAMLKMGNIVNSYLMENEALNLKIFFTHYFVDPGAPFLFFVIALFFAGVIPFYRKIRNLIAAPILFFLSVALFIAMIMWLMFYIVGHQMYITVFSSLLFGGLVYYAVRSGVFIKVLTALVIFLSASGIVRDMAFFPFFLERGVALAEARKEFQKMQSYLGERGRFGVTSALWTLSENYSQMYTYTWPEVPEKNTAAIFLQQAYGGKLTPPEIEGCRLAENHFNAPPKIFGLKLGSSLRDYSYAVFECGQSL